MVFDRYGQPLFSAYQEYPRRLTQFISTNDKLWGYFAEGASIPASKDV